MRFSHPIYPITDVRLSGLSHTEQIRRLSETGISIVQLREKNMSACEFAADASEALKIARQFGIKLLINDRVDIALAIGADGVHLGQTDLPPEHARKLLGPDAIIGYSTHNAVQAAAAIKLPVDYVAAGPVFETSSKENPDKVIGLASLIEIKSIVSPLPLVAIGGITNLNINAVSKTGADSAALIGAVFSPEIDAKTAVDDLQRSWKNKNV